MSLDRTEEQLMLPNDICHAITFPSGLFDETLA
jgi:hypothetical protein